MTSLCCFSRADLFHDIEERADELGVQSFGVSMTTLEEVFLKIGEEDEADDDDQDSGNGELVTPPMEIVCKCYGVQL